MDDSLEQPTSTATDEQLKATENDDNDSADEGDDGGLDWTKLFNKASIPKRGEKQFEPGLGLGQETGLQQTVLQRARNAMFNTLQATRSRDSKSLSHALWIPELQRAHVTIAKGVLLANMGHSARRPVTVDGQVKSHKRLELLPEEAIYLIERGSLFCWKHGQFQASLDDMPGAAMSVQQAYSEMVGLEGLSLEKFQVYAYLKRLGYNVTRSTPPNDSYPSAAPFHAAPLPPPPSIFQTLWERWKRMLLGLSTIFRTIDWWHPLSLRCKDYPSLFRSLRSTIPPSRVIALPPAPPDTPYKPFWNIYKPPTPFQKSNPGPPDHQIIVVNARTTRMPSLQELLDLFEVYPEIPLPPPKKKATASTAKSFEVAASPPSLFRQLFSFFWPSVTQQPRTQKGNPFPALRWGRKMVVVAVVDNGNIGFYRFAEGVFSEWEMQ